MTTAATSAGDARVLMRLLQWARPHRTLLTAGLLLYVPLHLGTLAQPFLLGVAVDQMMAPATGRIALPALGLAYVGAIFTQTVGQFAQLSCVQALGLRVTHDLRNALFAKLHTLEASWFDRTPRGQVMVRFTQDVDAVHELFTADAATVLGDLVFLVATAIILWWTSPTLTLASGVVLPVLAWGVWWCRAALREAWKEVGAQAGALHGFLQEHVSGMLVVQLLGQQERSMQRFDDLNRAGTLANHRAIALDAVIHALVESMGHAAVALALLAAAHETSANALSLGAALAFVEYVQRFFQPVKDLASKSTVLQGALSGVVRVFELLDMPVPPRPSPVREPAAGDVVFDDVSFAYQAGTNVLSNVSFCVPHGSTVALVGRTGSGKSTLARLLLGHRQPQSGRITLAGHNVLELDRTALARTILLMPQDVYLFPGTVAQNLRFGAPDATTRQLWQALEDTQARAFVEALPGGLDAQLSERGSNLSVGQRQLLAFARALLANPPCILLDEATASVDPDTERRLQAAAARVLCGRTALVIAHRLSTLAGSDNIVVLDAGRVVEQGTHQHLCAAGGTYAHTVALERVPG